MSPTLEVYIYITLVNYSYLRPSSMATYFNVSLQSNLSSSFCNHFCSSILFASVYSAQTMCLNLALALMLAKIVGPHPKITTVSPSGTKLIYKVNRNGCYIEPEISRI